MEDKKSTGWIRKEQLEVMYKYKLEKYPEMTKGLTFDEYASKFLEMMNWVMVDEPMITLEK